MTQQQHRRNFSIDFEKLKKASQALNNNTRLNSEDILLSITTSSSSIPTLETQRHIHSTPPQHQSNDVLNLEPKASTTRHRSRNSLYTINKCQELANTLNQITFTSASKSLLRSKTEGFVSCNNKGVALDKEGKYEEAIECYDEAIALKPDYPDAHFNKGSTLDNLGRFEEAIKCYDTAIKLNPNNADAYYNKGVSLDSLGRYEEAISCYEKATSLKPDYFGAYNNKGILLDHLGKYEDAIESFNQAIILRPDSSDGYFNKGSTLHSLGKYKEAIERFNKAIGLKSDYFAAYINRGISLNSLGKYKKAIQSFNQVIEKNPNYVEAYIHKGHSLRFLKKYQEALENFSQVIKLRPDDPEAYLHRAELLKAIGKQKEASLNYNKAMELNPNYHETFINQGKQLNRTGKHQEAVEHYNKALALKPGDTEAYLNKGASLNELGKHQEALENFNKVIALEPENPEVYYKKGIALGKMGKNQEALESYNLAIELKPGHSEAHNKKGNLLNTLGRHEEALDSYQRAIELEPECSEGYENKGNILDNMGKYEEAVEYYGKAAELQPNDVILHCNLASNMLKAGDEKGALEEFHRAELLLETKDQKEMDEGTVNLVKGALSKITEVENVANEAGDVLKELDHASPAVQKLQKAFNKIQGKKKDILAGLNFRKCGELSIGELEAIRKDILKAQKEIKDLKAAGEKTKEKLSQVEQELDNKMDDFHKKLVSKLASQGINKKDIEKLQGYFTAFLDTFSSCYNTSQIVESGQLELDMGNDVADILSTLASFSPFFGEAISNGISKIGEFLALKEMKTNARKMLNLAADTNHMSQIAGEIGYKILIEKSVQGVILKSSEKILNKGFDNKLQKIIKFCQDLGEKLDTKLYTERYKTSYRKLGNNDATGLIELWLEEGYKEGSDIEKIKKKFVEKIFEDYENFEKEENALNGVGDQNVLNPKSKANCCNIF